MLKELTKNSCWSSISEKVIEVVEEPDTVDEAPVLLKAPAVVEEKPVVMKEPATKDAVILAIPNQSFY